MSGSSFPSIATNESGSSSPFIRLSPTAFFKNIASSTPSTPLNAKSPRPGPTIISEATSPVNGLTATPKSHHRRANGSNPNCARKKLCYPLDQSTQIIASTIQTPQAKKAMQKSSTPRTVSLITKPMSNIKSPQALDTLLQSGGRQSREKQCQSAPAVSMYDNFSTTTNVYATPPRNSLRRQQSASATMVSMGGGRFIPAFGSQRANVRFTPPIGEDVSALFAGSKFSDSPSAKSLPMPPSQWLDEVKSQIATRSPKISMSSFVDKNRNPLKNVTEEDPTTEEDESDSQSLKSAGPPVFHLDSSSSDGEYGKPIPKLQSQHSNVSSNGSLHDPASEAQLAQAVEGIRLDPLQLIASVAAS